MQGFNEELPKAVAHITQQLVEQGAIPNAYSVRVLKCEDQLFRTFGEWQVIRRPMIEVRSINV